MNLIEIKVDSEIQSNGRFVPINAGFKTWLAQYLLPRAIHSPRRRNSPKNRTPFAQMISSEQGNQNDPEDAVKDDGIKFPRLAGRMPTLWA